MATDRPTEKPPKPPKSSAPKAEHKRFADEVLAYDPYKHEPKGGMKPTDESGKE